MEKGSWATWSIRKRKIFFATSGMASLTRCDSRFRTVYRSPIFRQYNPMCVVYNFPVPVTMLLFHLITKLSNCHYGESANVIKSVHVHKRFVKWNYNILAEAMTVLHWFWHLWHGTRAKRGVRGPLARVPAKRCVCPPFELVWTSVCERKGARVHAPFVSTGNGTRTAHPQFHNITPRLLG